MLILPYLTPPPPPPPPPPPAPPLGRNQLTPGSGLPTELKDHIALKVTCHELGFEDGDPDHTKILQDDNNIFTNKETTPGEKRILDIHGSDNKVKKIKFDAKLIPVITNGNDKVINENSPYMEFGPVTMSNTEDIKMNMYAQVTIDFEWTEAVINIKEALIKTDSEDVLKGTYPENAGDGNGNEWDLSMLHKYMKDVTFSDNLKAKIFFSGPDEIIQSFQPDLKNFDALWGIDGKQRMVEDQKLVAGNKLPKLPGENHRGEWVYSGTALPEGEGLFMAGFDEIILASPKDLYFNYEMKMGYEGTVTVYPNTFKDDEGDSSIKALMVVLMPLELKVAPGGYFSIPGDIFGGDSEGAADLFGRNSPDDFSLFTGVNIKSVGIKMDFGYSLFAGSYLHFDKGDKEGKNKLFGDEGLYMGENNSLNITFTGEQQKIINDHLIYPDIKFVYPDGRTVQIGRYSLPVRIVIAASASYTLNLDDFDDLFGSGN